MKILFMGGHELGAITLENLIKNNVEVVGVVITDTTNSWYKGVDDVANKYNLVLYKEKNINSDLFLKEIKKLNIDLIVSVNFEQILKKEIISIPKYGCINTHASILPKYRGRAPLNWAIINGEKQTGVTVHFIEEGIDTGNIICQEKVCIKENDYIEDLLIKVKNIYPSIVLKAIKIIQNDKFYKGIKQDLSKGSYFGKRTAEDGLIDINKSGEEIYNLIRAISKPYPGAFLIDDNKKIIIWKASLDYSNHINYKNSGIGKLINNENYLYLKLKDSILQIEDYSIEEYKND